MKSSQPLKGCRHSLFKTFHIDFEEIDLVHLAICTKMIQRSDLAALTGSQFCPPRVSGLLRQRRHTLLMPTGKGVPASPEPGWLNKLLVILE